MFTSIPGQGQPLRVIGQVIMTPLLRKCGSVTDLHKVKVSIPVIDLVAFKYIDFIRSAIHYFSFVGYSECRRPVLRSSPSGTQSAVYGG